MELLFRLLFDPKIKDPVVWVQSVSMWELYWAFIGSRGKSDPALCGAMWAREVLCFEAGGGQSLELCQEVHLSNGARL